MKNTCLLLGLCISLLPTTGLMAQSSSDTIARKKYFTQRLNGTITLDGIHSEEAWNAVEWGGDFIQNQPSEGKPPHQPTSFKIIYDDKFLYIAYRCHDSAPDSIVKRMGRRDEFPGDWVEINIDSYHDKRTAFSFTLSVSGVRNDEFVTATLPSRPAVILLSNPFAYGLPGSRLYASACAVTYGASSIWR